MARRAFLSQAIALPFLGMTAWSQQATRKPLKIFFKSLPGMSRIRRVLRLTHESAQDCARIGRRKRHEIHFDDELPEDGL